MSLAAAHVALVSADHSKSTYFYRVWSEMNFGEDRDVGLDYDCSIIVKPIM